MAKSVKPAGAKKMAKAEAAAMASVSRQRLGEIVNLVAKINNGVIAAPQPAAQTSRNIICMK